jgi:hypothetical protein
MGAVGGGEDWFDMDGNIPPRYNLLNGALDLIGDRMRLDQGSGAFDPDMHVDKKLGTGRPDADLVTVNDPRKRLDVGENLMLHSGRSRVYQRTDRPQAQFHCDPQGDEGNGERSEGIGMAQKARLRIPVAEFHTHQTENNRR